MSPVLLKFKQVLLLAAFTLGQLQPHTLLMNLIHYFLLTYAEDPAQFHLLSQTF